MSYLILALRHLVLLPAILLLALAAVLAVAWVTVQIDPTRQLTVHTASFGLVLIAGLRLLLWLRRRRAIR